MSLRPEVFPVQSLPASQPISSSRFERNHIGTQHGPIVAAGQDLAEVALCECRRRYRIGEWAYYRREPEQMVVDVHNVRKVECTDRVVSDRPIDHVEHMLIGHLYLRCHAY
jgi:hypothetical protein